MKQPRFDFLSYSRFVTSLSLTLSVVAVVWIITNGLNYGIDFAGGNEIQIRFQQAPTVEKLRKYISEKGFASPSVQTFGDEENEFLIFIENITDTESVKLKKQPEKKESAPASADVDSGVGSDVDSNTPASADSDAPVSANATAIENLIKSFKQDFSEQGVEIRKVDSVGPQIGSELRKKGILAVFYSLIMILIYLAIRFDYKFAPPAVICLFHDAALTMWIFALFDLVVNVQTLAALLAIIGYSLNDTIVTFDRIRENGEYFGKKESFSKLCNRSINDVLSRTLLTSLTTMVAVGMMWYYTNGVIKDFAFTLGVGVIIGTYSSIYVATPLVIFINYLQKKRKS